MKILTLKNGVSYNLTDASTIYNCMSVVSSFADIDIIAANMTAENLSVCTFNGVQFRDIIPVNISANRDEAGNITITMINRDKTDTEKLEERQTEAEQALIELANLIANVPEEEPVIDEDTPEETEAE
jgi:alpha-L-arabinofuranosidase